MISSCSSAIFGESPPRLPPLFSACGRKEQWASISLTQFSRARGKCEVLFSEQGDRNSRSRTRSHFTDFLVTINHVIKISVRAPKPLRDRPCHEAPAARADHRRLEVEPFTQNEG